MKQSNLAREEAREAELRHPVSQRDHEVQELWRSQSSALLGQTRAEIEAESTRHAGDSMARHQLYKAQAAAEVQQARLNVEEIADRLHSAEARRQEENYLASLGEKEREILELKARLARADGPKLTPQPSGFNIDHGSGAALGNLGSEAYHEKDAQQRGAHHRGRQDDVSRKPSVLGPPLITQSAQAEGNSHHLHGPTPVL